LAYKAFTPLDDWSHQPWAITYVCKGQGLCITQLRPTHTRDIVFLQLQSRNSLPVTLINIYNAPIGSTNANEAINTLLSCPLRRSPSTFLAGDLNLHSRRWNPILVTESSLTNTFTDWLDQAHFIYTAQPGVATHIRGNILDLAFISGPYTASTTIAKHLQVTSDYSPLLTTINWDLKRSQIVRRLRLDTLDHKQFITLLKEALLSIPISPLVPTTEELDAFAAGLTRAISTAYNGSAKRSYGQGTGVPWWNEACKEAVNRNKYSPIELTARNLRNTIRNAKRAYWTNKLDNVQVLTDVYKMTKWHKSTGTYRSPPFADPQNPTHSLAIDISDKRDILIRNLLSNTAEAGDIPYNTPAVLVRSIRFPTITAADIRKAILEAGNTALGQDEISTAILQTA